MKKIYAYLNGGVGNQMFQYAAARSLASRNGAELVLDTWSGFVRDRQYNRHYELGAFPIQGRCSRQWERLPIWLYRLSRRGRHVPTTSPETNWFGEFLVELTSTKSICRVGEQIHYSYQPLFHSYMPKGSAWVVGYWQCPLYFEDIKTDLLFELMPKAPVQNYLRMLGEEIQRCESVALGIRLYEESANPSAHALDGHIKSVFEIQSAIERLRSLRPSARFYIFCTHRAQLLSKLDLPSDTVFVTKDEGFNGTLETLWLLTRCRHHIFTNSSFYWWGAWLSAAVRGDEGQHIIAADNFINRDSLCATWERF